MNKHIYGVISGYEVPQTRPLLSSFTALFAYEGRPRTMNCIFEYIYIPPFLFKILDTGRGTKM